MELIGNFLFHHNDQEVLLFFCFILFLTLPYFSVLFILFKILKYDYDKVMREYFTFIFLLMCANSLLFIPLMKMAREYILSERILGDAFIYSMAINCFGTCIFANTKRKG